MYVARDHDEQRDVAFRVLRADFAAARPLFQTRAKPGRGYAYDVSADGQRILVNTVGQGN